MENIGIGSKAATFVNYLKKNYLNSLARFPKSMWNHWDNPDERTNNRIEGDNLKMKNLCGAENPQIEKTVDLVRQYERTARNKYLNAKKSTARAPSHRHETANS